MKWNYNDGGRSKYFRAASNRDCVIRAVAIAAQADYKEVYDTCKKISGKTPADGVTKKDVKKLLARYNGQWVPTMGIGTGCKTHLKDGELPAKGRIVCQCSGHLTAVTDGVIQDTFNPDRNETRCVYGYWKF